MNDYGDRTAFDYGTQVHMEGDEFYQKATEAKDDHDDEEVNAELEQTIF